MGGFRLRRSCVCCLLSACFLYPHVYGRATHVYGRTVHGDPPVAVCRSTGSTPYQPPPTTGCEPPHYVTRIFSAIGFVLFLCRIRAGGHGVGLHVESNRAAPKIGQRLSLQNTCLILKRERGPAAPFRPLGAFSRALSDSTGLSTALFSHPAQNSDLRAPGASSGQPCQVPFSVVSDQRT